MVIPHGTLGRRAAVSARHEIVAWLKNSLLSLHARVVRQAGRFQEVDVDVDVVSLDFLSCVRWRAVEEVVDVCAVSVARPIGAPHFPTNLLHVFGILELHSLVLRLDFSYVQPYRWCVSANILSQLAPGAGVEVVLFSAASGTRANLAEIIVCNRSGGANSFRVSISRLGAATATKDYLYFNTPITGNDVISAEMDVTIDAHDVVRVFDTNGTLTFTLFGASV